MSGFQQTSANPCDFICFTKGKLYLVECKEHKGMSIPFSAIRQYEKLLSFKGLKDVYPGVTIWFSEKGTVIWVSVEEMEKMVSDGKKSISLKMLEEKQYNIIEIPEIPSLRRKFPNSDYSVLIKED